MKYHLRLNGKRVSRKEFHRKGPVGGEGVPLPPTDTYSTARPLVTTFMGCLPHQVEQTRRELKERNIQGVDVLPNGAFSITSRRGRKEANAMAGLHDGDGGYSD